MNRRKPNPSKGLPSRQPCSQCGRVPLNPRLKHCPVCGTNATVAFYLAFERSQEEQRKVFHLCRLRAVLIVAGLYLTKSEVEAIRQTINDAIKRPLHLLQHEKRTEMKSGRND